MNILYITLSSMDSNTSAMLRNKALLHGLLDYNHNVDLIALKPTNYTFKNNNQIPYKNINIIKLEGNKIYKYIVNENNTFIGRIKRNLLPIVRGLYQKFYVFDNTITVAKSLDTDILPNAYYDLIISSSDPKTSHYAAKTLIDKGLKYGQWIQYWGDPMTLDITKKFIYPNWIMSRIEKRILCLADKIIYVSPFTLKSQKNMFSKVADKMFFLPIPYTEEKIYKRTNNEVFTIGYFGAYYSKVRNIEPLYNACNGMQENIFLNIIGDSDLNLDDKNNIKIYPRGDISAFEDRSDLLVCILNKKGSQIPGKIYHSAATNKPVLVILDGDNAKEMEHYLASFERFVLCKNNEKSIKEAILNIISKNDEYSPATQFSPKRIARDILEIKGEK